MIEPIPDGALNRADRRYIEKHDLPCKVCGVRWSQRAEIWSMCTIGSQPGMTPDGHRFL